jgi:hypothetical protein
MSSHLALPTVCLACLFLVGNVDGQEYSPRTPRPASGDVQHICPQVSVSCPSYFNQGYPITFTASVNGGSPNVVPSYNWTISAGRIVQGQGTSSIKVDTAGFGGHGFTATVSISGFDQSCPSTASCSIVPGLPAPPAVLFDRYYPKSPFSATGKRRHARRRVHRRH